MSIKVSNIQAKLGNKKGLYWAMIRNNYCLPDINSPIINKPYLWGVYYERVWVPKTDKMKRSPKR